MTAQVRFSKYSLVDPQAGVVVESDLQSPVSVKREVLSRVEEDLKRFTHLQAAELPDYQSKLTLMVGDQQVQVERAASPAAGKQQELDAQLQQLLPDWTGRDNEFVINGNLSDDELQAQVDQLRASAGAQSATAATGDAAGQAVEPSGAVQTEGDQVQQLKAQLQQIGGEAWANLDQAEGKLEALEAELAAQRRADEAQISLGELEASIADIEGTLSAVTDVLQRQSKVTEVLAKYGPLLQKDLEKDSVQFREEMQQIREQQILANQKSGMLTIAKDSINSEKEQEELHLKANLPRFLLVLPVLILGLAGLGYLISGDLLVLVFGLLGMIVQVGVIFLFRATPSMSPVGGGHAETIGSAVASADQPKDKVSFLERFFVDKAWITALRAEQQELAEIIKQKLGGVDATALEAQKQQLNVEIEQLKTDIEAQKGKEISPEDYLRKRRELDMLKIEKSRLESELRKQPNYDQISELQQKLQTGKISTDSDSVLPTLLNLKIQKWQESPTMPLVLVDVLAKLPGSARQLVDAKMSELQNLGQVIQVEVVG